jgi:hypothetical protein
MNQSSSKKQDLAKFGRMFSLLLKRASMYQVGHPYLEQSLEEFFPVATRLLDSISPLVFAMHREQFFIDEEPLDPRINVDRMLALFKKTGIQSVSFNKGIGINEVRSLLEVFESPGSYGDVEAMKRALTEKGATHLQINYVLFKKVTDDDEVVSRERLREVMPDLSGDAQHTSKKLLLDTMLETALAEELDSAVTVDRILEYPAQVSKRMIDVDVDMSRKGSTDAKKAGAFLLKQLETMGHRVDESLADKEAPDLSKLAAAVLDMKRQLQKGIEAQKALDIVYGNEGQILHQANEITDRVVIQLVKQEYRSGDVSIPRLAQILRRLIPEGDELKRLLPKIKSALLEEGMSMEDYLNLVQDLVKELQSDTLVGFLEQGSDEIGMERTDLIQEVERNPTQVAELICLAAEVRKTTGDEGVLSDLLVTYVERLSTKLAGGMGSYSPEGEKHLRQVVSGLESGIVSKLRDMDLEADVLARLEEKLEKKLDAMFEEFRSQWGPSQQVSHKEPAKDLTVLQILEQSVDPTEELAHILRDVRTRADVGDIDENDFREIYGEIFRQRQKRLALKARKRVTPHVLEPRDLLYFLEKEICSAKRYGLPFSALSFSIVKAKPEKQPPKGSLTSQDLMDAILKRLALNLRDADILGHLGGNKVVALLPMTIDREAKLALRRNLRLLHARPIVVNGIPLNVRIAGAVTDYDIDKSLDRGEFVRLLSEDLTKTIHRVKHIQELF